MLERELEAEGVREPEGSRECEPRSALPTEAPFQLPASLPSRCRGGGGWPSAPKEPPRQRLGKRPGGGGAPGPTAAPPASPAPKSCEEGGGGGRPDSCQMRQGAPSVEQADGGSDPKASGAAGLEEHLQSGPGAFGKCRRGVTRFLGLTLAMKSLPSSPSGGHSRTFPCWKAAIMAEGSSTIWGNGAWEGRPEEDGARNP